MSLGLLGWGEACRVRVRELPLSLNVFIQSRLAFQKKICVYGFERD